MLTPLTYSVMAWIVAHFIFGLRNDATSCIYTMQTTGTTTILQSFSLILSEDHKRSNSFCYEGSEPTIVAFVATVQNFKPEVKILRQIK